MLKINYIEIKFKKIVINYCDLNADSDIQRYHFKFVRWNAKCLSSYHEEGCDMIWVMTFDTKANQESDKLTEQSDT